MEIRMRHDMHPFRSWAVTSMAASFILWSSYSFAQDDSSADTSAETLVPQQLMGLLHAPEVHRELGLSDQQVHQLEQLFSRVDGYWFRARVLPADQKRQKLDEIETGMRRWLGNNLSREQVERVEQLTLQAQGIRCLLRPDVGQKLELSSEQTSELVALAKAANDAANKLRIATMKNEVTDEVREAAQSAGQKEQNAFRDVLQPEQQQRLAGLIGTPFNTSSLRRIYPMAPELVSVENWINSRPLTLKGLRGKVVLLHFYAFQCHNCHANFEHYQRWHEKYGDDVVVIGIQTPETPRERDPQAVREAAKERDLAFPILVDLESKNWDSWANTMWPTVYVIDKNGYIRQWWQGELNWNGATGDETIENLVASLLEEKVGS